MIEYISLLLFIILAYANNNYAIGLFLLTSFWGIDIIRRLEPIFPKFDKSFGKNGTITLNVFTLLCLYMVIMGGVFLIYFSPGVFMVFFIFSALCNGLPVALNRGLMPCSPTEFLKMTGGLAEVDSCGQIQADNFSKGYCYTNPETKLSFLGDNFYVKSLGGINSIGDFLLLMGLICGIIEQIILILKPA